MKRLRTFPTEELVLESNAYASIILDLDATSAYSEKDALALENYLKKAETFFNESGIDISQQLEQIRQSSRELLSGTGALLLYVTQEQTTYYHIQQRVIDRLVVGQFPYLKPLVQYYQFALASKVLLLNQDSARIFELDGGELNEIENDTWPIQLTEALGDEKVGGELTHGTYGSRGTEAQQSYHGHNETSKEKEIDRENFFRYVEKALAELNQDDRSQVVLFALPENQVVYRRINTVSTLLEDGIESSGAQLSDAQITEYVQGFVEDYANKQELALLQRFEETSPTFKVEQMEEIVSIAKEGRIEELILSPSVSLDETKDVEKTIAAISKNVLETAGKIYVVETKNQPIVARLRY